MKLKHVDNFTWSFLLMIVGFFLATSTENKAYWFFSILGITLAVYTQKYLSGEIVENKYPGKIAVKNENGSCEPTVFENQSTVSGVDGAVTKYNTDQVFKISNGIKVKVLPSGKITETTLLARIINKGYTTSLVSDDCWKPLYLKAKELI